MASPTDKPIELAKSQDRKIYQTTYKKGQMLGIFHFEHEGELPSAMNEAKKFLEMKNLRHVHTVPFIVDLKKELLNEDSFLST